MTATNQKNPWPSQRGGAWPPPSMKPVSWAWVDEIERAQSHRRRRKHSRLYRFFKAIADEIKYLIAINRKNSRYGSV